MYISSSSPICLLCGARGGGRVGGWEVAIVGPEDALPESLSMLRHCSPFSAAWIQRRVIYFEWLCTWMLATGGTAVLQKSQYFRLCYISYSNMWSGLWVIQSTVTANKYRSVMPFGTCAYKLACASTRIQGHGKFNCNICNIGAPAISII